MVMSMMATTNVTWLLIVVVTHGNVCDMYHSQLELCSNVKSDAKRKMYPRVDILAYYCSLWDHSSNSKLASYWSMAQLWGQLIMGPLLMSVEILWRQILCWLRKWCGILPELENNSILTYCCGSPDRCIQCILIKHLPTSFPCALNDLFTRCKTYTMEFII